MRIISGKYRGKKVEHYSDNKTRPTIGRVRESIFNVLSNMDFNGGKRFDNARILDLFAGSGAYGLECYSRGAAQVVFNDIDHKAVQTIKKNAHSIDLSSITFNKSFEEVLESLARDNSSKVDSEKTGDLKRKFDLIFLDPPYHSNFGEKSIKLIVQNDLLDKDGVIVFETDDSCRELTEEISNRFDVRIKQYGRVSVNFLKYS